MSNGFEKLFCNWCNTEFEIKMQAMRRRHFKTDGPICKECYKTIPFSASKLKELPIILNFDHSMYRNAMPYDIFVKYIDFISIAKEIIFKCDICSNYDTMTYKCMKGRKICGTKPICRKCSLAYAVGSDEWRNKNSKAQFIAQNRPEVLEKQRASQKRLMEEDPLYAEKRSSKSYISGTIRGFRFDSSWELYFLAYCWTNPMIDSIVRYEGSIDYFDSYGIKRKYFPDFIVKYADGEQKVIEIKGTKKYNNFHEKFNAALVKHGANYVVLEESDLLKLGIHFRRETYLADFYKKYYNEITFFENRKTKLLIPRIEKWLDGKHECGKIWQRSKV